MAWLDPIRRGADNLYESLSEGWDWLRQRGASALTRFRPGDEDQVQGLPVSEGDGLRRDAWGLLASSVAATDGEVIAQIEAPGMKPGDFSLLVDDDELIVRGTKRMDREEKNARYHLVETAYGRFERRIPLPCEVDADRARATYERGVLHVRLPRAEKAHGQRIRVQAG